MHLASFKRLVYSLPAAALILSLFLAGTRAANAQTIAAVSNLDQSAYASVQVLAISSIPLYSRLAQSFTTGASAFLLDNITVKIYDGTNSGSGFSVDLYSDLDGQPGSLIETLSGSNQPSSGDYAYTSAGSTTLAADSTYWWVASLSEGGSRSTSLWETNSTAETGLSGWTIGDGHAYSGSSTGGWSSTSSPLQFSVNGSAVPEPSTYAAFAGLAALGLAAFRRRRRAAV